MTPGEIVTYARQQLNAVGDDFYADTELYSHIWAAEKELAKNGLVIERTYTTTTTASQQEYSFPTNAIAIKRITYEGSKLMPISQREDDALTLSNQTTTASGTPQYYTLWNRTIALRPIPDSTGTLKIWSYDQPAQVSSTSTLEVPEDFHLKIADFVLEKMAAKNQNYQAADYYGAKWREAVKEARSYWRKIKRTDSFAAVTDLETIPVTVVGAV